MYVITATRERWLIRLLALTQFTLIMDFMVMMPLGPQIMQALSITPAAFAGAVSAYSWCAGLSGLLATTYIDRFDRRRLLLVVYALFALANLGCALASNYPMLLAARAFAGITGGVLGSVIMAIVGDVVPANRRGAAMGIIMTAFSLAAIIGIPMGVLLGAHFNWAAPFMVLMVLSVLVILAASRVVPSLTQHLHDKPLPFSQVLPELWRLLSNLRHVNAFAVTFTLMMSHMLIIPFIAPLMVANYGVLPEQLSWLYLAGGVSTFFTSRLIGRLADRYGSRRVFCIAVVCSMVPALCITHLPALSLTALVLFFACFMVIMSGRVVPMQALLITIPEPSRRGAFLSANNALQAMGTGCGAWAGGLLLSTDSGGHLIGFGTVGWVAVAMLVLVLLLVSRLKPARDTNTAVVIGDGVASH